MSSDHVALAEKLASSRGDAFRYILQTSQAADIFNGGIKANALPEKRLAERSSDGSKSDEKGCIQLN